MNRKRQVGALDFLVSTLLYTLDIQLMPVRGLGWRPSRLGFDYQIEPGRLNREKKLQIYPVEWPAGSFIVVRILSFNGEDCNWNADKGTICRIDSKVFNTPTSIEFHSGSPGFVMPMGSGDSQKILLDAARRLRPDLSF